MPKPRRNPLQLLRQIPQYTRNSRHLWSVLKHGNPRKWANLLLAETERKLRRVRLRSRPYLLILDPCNYCNLRCPLCPTGLKDLGRPQAMLSHEHFLRYFEPFAPYLFEVYMHNWGESLINKNVYGMIEHAQRRNVGTNLSSNFVLVDSGDIDALLDSGLEYLIVSLDGTDQQSYAAYRRRGSFDRVVENLGELIRRRNLRGRKTPVVEWQYIVMRTNEHKIGEAEVMAAKLGVDRLRFIPVGMPHEFTNREEVAEQWYPRTVEGRVKSDFVAQQFGQAGKPGPCFYLYRSVVINPDGGVSPCCVVYRKKWDFADLATKAEIDVRELWNNDLYVAGRSLFSRRDFGPQPKTVCDGCDIFTRPANKPVMVETGNEPPMHPAPAPAHVEVPG